MKRPFLLTRQDGFTLIEIIAVLILLGILAAVAVPKYLSLQDKAELRAVAGLKAELTSRANQYYAQYLLDNTETQNGQGAGAWANETIEDIGSDFEMWAGGGGAYMRVRLVGSSNFYHIAFTRGINRTDGTGSPAIFGTISAE